VTILSAIFLLTVREDERRSKEYLLYCDPLRRNHHIRTAVVVVAARHLSLPLHPGCFNPLVNTDFGTRSHLVVDNHRSLVEALKA
jgi:hypothetical protein